MAFRGALIAAALLATPAAAQDIERYPSVGLAADMDLPFSAMVAHGDTLYLSGVIGYDPETGELPDGVETQTRFALEDMRATLGQVGGDLSHVLNCIVFLKDMGDYDAMNGVFREFFDAHKPARTTMQAVPPIGAALEISCIAARPAEADD